MLVGFTKRKRKFLAFRDTSLQICILMNTLSYADKMIYVNGSCISFRIHSPMPILFQCCYAHKKHDEYFIKCLSFVKTNVNNERVSSRRWYDTIITIHYWERKGKERKYQALNFHCNPHAEITIRVSD